LFILAQKSREDLTRTCPEYYRRIIKAFSDFRLVQQIREEIEKVKSFLVLAV